MKKTGKTAETTTNQENKQKDNQNKGPQRNHHKSAEKDKKTAKGHSRKPPKQMKKIEKPRNTEKARKPPQIRGKR